MKKERELIKNRIKAETPEAPLVKGQYYSSWIFAAVHIACLSSTRQTPERIATSLGLPLSAVHEALEFLQNSRLVVEEKGRYQVQVSRLHLSARDHHLKNHHVNWRLAAIRQIQFGGEGNLHYSSVMSISSSVFERMKELLLKVVEDSEPLIATSPDDQVAVLNLDLFGIGR